MDGKTESNRPSRNFAISFLLKQPWALLCRALGAHELDNVRWHTCMEVPQPVSISERERAPRIKAPE